MFVLPVQMNFCPEKLNAYSSAANRKVTKYITISQSQNLMYIIKLFGLISILTFGVFSLLPMSPLNPQSQPENLLDQRGQGPDPGKTFPTVQYSEPDNLTSDTSPTRGAAIGVPFPQ
jgi:hypothetical protein